MLTELDASTQETAYALIALVEAKAAGLTGLDGPIDDVAQYLLDAQNHTGGWLTYFGNIYMPNNGENAEVNGEAVWALVAAGYYPLP